MSITFSSLLFFCGAESEAVSPRFPTASGQPIIARRYASRAFCASEGPSQTFQSRCPGHRLLGARQGFLADWIVLPLPLTFAPMTLVL